MIPHFISWKMNYLFTLNVNASFIGLVSGLVFSIFILAQISLSVFPLITGVTWLSARVVFVSWFFTAIIFPFIFAVFIVSWIYAYEDLV